MWYNREWWKPISEKITFACTESQLLQVLIGSIGVVPDGYFVLDNETATIFTDQVYMWVCVIIIFTNLLVTGLRL